MLHDPPLPSLDEHHYRRFADLRRGEVFGVGRAGPKPNRRPRGASARLAKRAIDGRAAVGKTRGVGWPLHFLLLIDMVDLARLLTASAAVAVTVVSIAVKIRLIAIIQVRVDCALNRGRVGLGILHNVGNA